MVAIRSLERAPAASKSLRVSDIELKVSDAVHVVEKGRKLMVLERRRPEYLYVQSEIVVGWAFI